MHSDDAAQREGAAFELWLTHVFCSQGFAPVREAVIPGSSKRSDYLLERLGTSVFVEARASLTAERFPTDVGERVKTVVREKLKKFASPPNCAVIAVDSPPPSSSTGIKQGLLGDRNYVGRDYVANMPPNFVVRTHKRDGLFTTELSGGLIGTTLSAILLHTVRHGESGCVHEAVVLHNPHATHPLPTAFFAGIAEVRFTQASEFVPKGIPDADLVVLNRCGKKMYNSGPQAVWAEDSIGALPSWWKP